LSSNSVTIDAANNVLAVDSANNNLRRIAVDATVTTILGTLNQDTVVLGALPAGIGCVSALVPDSAGTRLFLTVPNAVLVATLS